LRLPRIGPLLLADCPCERAVVAVVTIDVVVAVGVERAAVLGEQAAAVIEDITVAHQHASTAAGGGKAMIAV